jgi:pSer/pThr/pTyr-binding forkhead associated (FHA) protein
MHEQHATFRLSGDLIGGAREWRRQQIRIGSDDQCELQLAEHFTISETHARIEWDGENFYLIDTDQANATFVNHRQVEYHEPVALAGHDTVQIGPHVLRLESDGTELRIEVSSLLVKSRFVIKRLDLDKTSADVSFTHEVLLICNPPDQLAAGSSGGRLILNHPKVSPLHAGISRFRDRLDQTTTRFCLIDLSSSNTTYLNNRLLNTDEAAALAPDDVAQIGPYDLTFALGDEETLHVSVQISVAGTATTVNAAPAQPVLTTTAAPAQVAADALRIFWAKRTRDKAARLSPLHPAVPARVGKARYKWRATTDLVRAWPLNLLPWCAFVAVLFVAVITLVGLKSFSPRPLSTAHASAAFVVLPATAREPNANACTTCHAAGRAMNEQCASCHQAGDVFVATVTPKHRAAGIGCTDCHTEHKGADFRPGIAPLSAQFQPDVNPEATCIGCHNDANNKLYNGLHVHTPHADEHKGKFGYPVSAAGAWLWRGLDAEEWTQKLPDVAREFARPDYTNQPSAQFHALHVGRVRARAVSLPGNNEGLLSCSSCHTSWGKKLDRKTPSQTCAKCHNGRTDTQTRRALITSEQPDCTSCHIQHVMDKRRIHPLLVATDRKERP